MTVTYPQVTQLMDVGNLGVNDFQAWKASFDGDAHVPISPKARRIALFTIDAALSFTMSLPSPRAERGQTLSRTED